MFAQGQRNSHIIHMACDEMAWPTKTSKWHSKIATNAGPNKTADVLKK